MDAPPLHICGRLLKKKKKMKLLEFQVSSKEEMGLFTVVSGLYNASEIAIH